MEWLLLIRGFFLSRPWLAIFLLLSISNVFSQPCKEIVTSKSKKAKRHWTINDVDIKYGDHDDYRLIKRLGVGGFGEVYFAKNVKFNVNCVVKLYTRKVDRDTMMREIAILQSVCGGPNIVKIYDALYLPSVNASAVVMEHVNFTHFSELFPKLTGEDIRFYMRKLLVSMQYLHQHGIIHRDIKPHNYLIDPISREARVIDFGTSAFYYPGTDHNVAGTYLFMAPEALLFHSKQTPKVDIWSFGVMLAGMLFKKVYFFGGDNTIARQLEAYSAFFGTEAMQNLATSLDIDRNISAFRIYRPAKTWKQYITALNKHLVTEDALEVLNRTLQYVLYLSISFVVSPQTLIRSMFLFFELIPLLYYSGWIQS